MIRIRAKVRVRAKVRIRVRIECNCINRGVHTVRTCLGFRDIVRATVQG